MIKVNIAEIEKLTDILVKAASSSDEALSRLRRVSTEMHDDLELPLYAQADILLEAVSMAIDALNRGNDTLQSLKNTVLPIANVYRETEQKNKNELSRMLTSMESISVGYNAAITSESIPSIEHADAIVSQNKVQQLVADSYEEMQVANIASLTKTVSEEYEVKKIEDFVGE